MANFRLLGNALIDFSNVLSVEACEDGPDFIGFSIKYKDGRDDFILYADNPKETLKNFYKEALAKDDASVPPPLRQEYSS